MSAPISVGSMRAPSPVRETSVAARPLPRGEVNFNESERALWLEVCVAGLHAARTCGRNFYYGPDADAGAAVSRWISAGRIEKPGAPAGGSRDLLVRRGHRPQARAAADLRHRQQRLRGRPTRS